MAATIVPVDAIPSLDPATGAILTYVEKTPPAALPEIIARARSAQTEWSRRSVSERCAQLGKLRERILASRAALADAVVAESGKPRVEALFADIFVALDSAAYFAANTERILR